MIGRVVRWSLAPTHRPIAYLAMGLVLLVGASIAFSVHQRSSERQQRDVAIAAAIKAVQKANFSTNEKIYQSALANCRRRVPEVRALITLARAVHSAHETLGGFFKGARGRAAAQSHDPNLSARSRAAAKASLVSIDHAIEIFSIPINVPAKPPSCLAVITDPNGVVAPQNGGGAP